jgi:hypothetical protein
MSVTVVIVTRAAYCDTIDKVIEFNGGSFADRKAAILKHYPLATNIGMSDFDHPDTENGYLYDTSRVLD